MHDRPNSFVVSYDIITIKLTFYMSSKLLLYERSQFGLVFNIVLQ